VRDHVDGYVTLIDSAVRVEVAAGAEVDVVAFPIVVNCRLDAVGCGDGPVLGGECSGAEVEAVVSVDGQECANRGEVSGGVAADDWRWWGVPVPAPGKRERSSA
jgi:hypothetical protein